MPEAVWKETSLGKLPHSWDVACLDDAASKVQDGTHFSPKTTSGPKRYLTSKNVRFGFLDITDCGWISEKEHAAIYRRCDVAFGDVLLTKDGACTGNATLNNLTEEFSLLSSVAVIRCRPDRLHGGVLLHYLLSDIGQKRLKDLMSGNAITRLTLDKIKQFKVPLPDRDEQPRIAEILDTLDAAIRETEAVVAKLRQVKAGLLHDLLTRGLDEHGHLRDPARHPEQFQDSPLGLVPRVWQVKPLGQIIQEHGGFMQTGPFGSQLHSKDYSTEGVAVLMPQDIRDDGSMDDVQAAKISESRALSLARHRLRVSDVVFARRGDLSRCCVVAEGKNAICGTGCLLFRPPLKAICSAWFAATYRHDTCQRQIAARAVGTTMVNLNTELLTGLWLRFPEFDEQERIAERIAAFELRLIAEQDHYAKLQALKRGLSHDLLTGGVRVTPAKAAKIQKGLST